MGFRVGVTTGLYQAARGEDLATTIRKIGYTITKGASVIEFMGELPSEVSFTEGKEARDILKKQGMTASYHGSLTVPMALPERPEWREADDHMKRSMRSAIHLGAVYVDFHASLNIWLELVTYAGRKLTVSFCDHRGRFISYILRENEQLRKWFLQDLAHLLAPEILTREERRQLDIRENNEVDRWRKNEITRGVRQTLQPIIARAVLIGPGGRPLSGRQLEEARSRLLKRLIEGAQARGAITETDIPAVDSAANRVLDDVREKTQSETSKIAERVFAEVVGKKLAAGKPWRTEELRGIEGTIEGYHIMFHYLFYTRDPQFTYMTRFYSGLLKDYRLDYRNVNWPDEAWTRAERENDLKFKEFFYGVVAAKYVEGHVQAIYDWIHKNFIPNELGKLPEKTPEQKRDKQELIRIAKNIKIGLETPDARDVTKPGRFLLWKPVQIYSAVKVIRELMKNDFVWMIPDFEHVATQGADALLEFEALVHTAPDYGEYVVSVHSNSPNPLHPHLPIELGDMTLYRIYWALRKTGLGKKNDVILLHERGGGEDPVQRSVDALKIMAHFIGRDVPPEELPPEFFGVEGIRAGNIDRQRQIIRDHAYDVMKDLLEIPEEEWTFLSQAVVKKGKRPEVWKRAEFR